MEFFPPDVIRVIFEYLTPSDQAVTRFVSRWWRSKSVSAKGGPIFFVDSIPVLQWAQTQGFRLNYLTFDSSVATGNLETLNWLVENKCSHDDYIAETAAQNGHLHALQWLLEKQILPKNCVFTCIVMRKAARKGNLEIVRWLWSKKCPCDQNVADAACGKGHLEIVKWLYNCGGPKCSQDGPYLAAVNGHVEMLKWLRTQGYRWVPGSIKFVVANGHLHVLKWANQNGGKLTSDLCCTAASYGHLHILQWLRENNCPWDKEKCLDEARKSQEFANSDPRFRDVIHWIEHQP